MWEQRQRWLGGGTLPLEYACSSGSMGSIIILGNIPAVVRTPTVAELDAIAALERSSYASDEAASAAALAHRLAVAPELFVGAYEAKSQALLGFVCGTRSPRQLTEESMSGHDPDGPLVCIHSVVVRADARRQGVATTLVREYLRRLPANTTVALIARAHHVPLYMGIGFASRGPSPVVHGAGTWMEMQMETGGPAKMA